MTAAKFSDMCLNRLVLCAFIAFVGCGECGAAPHGAPSGQAFGPTSTGFPRHGDGDTETTACPVCGLEMKKLEAPFRHEHGGKVYHFFLEDHRDAFALDPDAYLSAEK